MKVVMKRILKCFAIIVMALTVSWAATSLLQKYRYQWPVEKLNEVVYDISMRIWDAPHEMVYFERKGISNNSDAEYRDVYVLNAQRTWQTCRIEKNVLFNFQSLNHCGLRSNEGDTLWSAGMALHQMPNILQPDMTPSRDVESNSGITVVYFRQAGFRGLSAADPDPGNAITWSVWWIHKWAGTSNEAPAVVEAFYQRMIQQEAPFTDERKSALELLRQPDADYETLQKAYWMDFFMVMHYSQNIRAALALPDIRSYPAYLRAIPLITEADLAAAKDLPLIALEKTRLNVHYAVRAPYIVLPIPPKRSPFPTLKKFTPGDKVKVNYEGGCFLIETFVNGSIAEDSGKRK